MATMLQRFFPHIFSYNDDSYLVKIRKKRFDKLMNMLYSVSNEKKGVVQILDLGGSYEYWQQVGFIDPELFHITLLNLENPFLPESASNFSAVAGNACHCEFPDQSFDIVFSNSVIEHVGDFHDQQKMANEIIRIARKYAIIQTPNFWFPIEPHCQLPLFQFIPHFIRAGIIRWIKNDLCGFECSGLYRDCLKVSQQTRMLSKRSFQKLFPSATILTEKILGVSKSFTVVLKK